MTVLAFLLGIVVMLLGLGVSIALHEIGHLVPAKLFGVRVGQYMVGFGPTLWSRRKGETEYGLKALPVGGYISMAGMYPPSRAKAGSAVKEGFFRTMVQDARAANDETLDGAEDRTFFRLPVWKRVVVMLGGPVMNLVLAVVLATLVASGIGVSTVTTTIAAVSPCVPTQDQAEGCAPGAPLAPAAAAGVLPGDRIVAVDGRPVADFAEASALFREAPGRSMDLVVERDGTERSLRVTPVAVERPAVDEDGLPVRDEQGQAVLSAVGFVGVTAETTRVAAPLWTGVTQTAENVGRVASIVVQLPVKLFETASSLVTGAERDPNGPISLVGVGAIAGEVAATDTAPVLDRVAFILSLLASLNIALFVFNLLPLLPLDGGHVVVALWDGLRRLLARLRGRPQPRSTDATALVPVTFVVVVLMIAMGALLIVADVFNPLSLFG